MSDSNLLNQASRIINREPGEPSWACIDCIALLANGQWPDYMTEAELADYTVRFATNVADSEVSLGMLYKYHECGKADDPFNEIECECETQTFSTRTCATCGSNLAGSREAVTFWTEGTE